MAEEEIMEAYCVRCKAKKEMKDAVEATTKKGTKMMKGVCATCGCKMCKFIKQDK